jgi:hypothetical protein
MDEHIEEGTNMQFSTAVAQIAAAAFIVLMAAPAAQAQAVTFTEVDDPCRRDSSTPPRLLQIRRIRTN